MAQQWSGERMETFVYNESTIEHLHRYAIACHLAKNKEVLDLACGEGYGSHLLAQQASSVLGIDVDGDTIKKAAAKYIKTNLQFQVGEATRLQLNRTFDLVVSFETLEHVADHNEMITEIRKVLRPGGILIISTPDKKNYTDGTGKQNPHHKKELYELEFKDLIKSNFSQAVFFQQSFVQASVILENADSNGFKVFTGAFESMSDSKLPVAWYWIAIASDSPLPAIPASIFHNSDISRMVLQDEITTVKQTASYRLGHFLLSPLKFLRRIFRS